MVLRALRRVCVCLRLPLQEASKYVMSASTDMLLGKWGLKDCLEILIWQCIEATTKFIQLLQLYCELVAVCC